MGRYFTITTFLLIGIYGAADAGVKTKAAKEAAEYILGKFGKEAAEQGVETLTRKIEVLAVKHGDDAITAVKSVGPRIFRIVEEAGEHGSQAIKLMARHGDDAVWVVAKKNRLAIFVKYGDDAAESMMKHGELAEPLIQAMGKPAAGALNAVSKQNGRRLAMMADDGVLTKIGRTDEFLGVVRKHGDAAMDFIWANKGSLTVAAALTAFLANPEPFINGTADITKVVAENVGQPLASIPGQVASEAARTTNWTLVLSVVVIVVGGISGVRVWLRHRKAALAVLLCSSFLLSGCGTSALPPPVTVTYRSSFVGLGKVVVISNNSSHHLYNVRVVGRNFEEVSSASVKATDHLAPGSSVEVGWLEFESWVLQPGETIEVYADNYVSPKVSIIPSE